MNIIIILALQSKGEVFKWAIPDLFYFIFVFGLVLTVNKLMRNWFEPQISGVRSNQFTNCATTIICKVCSLIKKVKLSCIIKAILIYPFECCQSCGQSYKRSKYYCKLRLIIGIFSHDVSNVNLFMILVRLLDFPGLELVSFTSQPNTFPIINSNV